MYLVIIRKRIWKIILKNRRKYRNYYLLVIWDIQLLNQVDYSRPHLCSELTLMQIHRWLLIDRDFLRQLLQREITLWSTDAFQLRYHNRCLLWEVKVLWLNRVMWILSNKSEIGDRMLKLNRILIFQLSLRN
jgi:hypothetical protein